MAECVQRIPFISGIAIAALRRRRKQLDRLPMLNVDEELLHFGREQQAMEQVIGIMIVIVVIGLLADKIFFSPIEKFLHRRWGTSQA